MSPGTNVPPKNNSLLLKVAVVFVLVATCGTIFLYVNRDWNAPAAAKQLANPVPATDESIAMGMRSYAAHCQNCHGDKGDGKGPRAESLSIAPTDFTDAHEMGLATDGELFWKISHGHRPMPAFQGKLSEEARWQLVDFIRTFAQKPRTGAASATNHPSP